MTWPQHQANRGAHRHIHTCVHRLPAAGAHDVLRIELLEQAAEAEADGRKAGEGRKYVLLPFAKALVPTVDVAAGRMEIVPPEGLLELATSGTPKRERRESRGQRERRGGRREKGQGAGGEGAGSSAEES